jgi:WD40 repeat protein
VTDLPIVETIKGDQVQPCNLLLHDNEGQLVFKNEKDPTQLFIYDLETGKVVQQIKTGKEIIKFNSISNDMKNGQKEAERTLFGVETQGIHQLDPRVGGNSLINSKTYKTNVLFNTISPTVSGGFAVGSANGDIRMYKQMGQIAKTYLPGLGEQIKSIDIS